MSACGPIVRVSERGLSLLELLIVVSLLSIFIGTVYESVVVGLRTVNAADEREDIRQQLAGALDASLVKPVWRAMSTTRRTSGFNLTPISMVTARRKTTSTIRFQVAISSVSTTAQP